MADLQGVCGVQSNPCLSPNYFIFMRNSENMLAKSTPPPPLAKLTSFLKYLNPPLSLSANLAYDKVMTVFSSYQKNRVWQFMQNDSCGDNFHEYLYSFTDCTDREQMLTLLSELKILIHIGQHLNIVNLLGAVTKNIARGKLIQ